MSPNFLASSGVGASVLKLSVLCVAADAKAGATSTATSAHKCRRRVIPLTSVVSDAGPGFRPLKQGCVRSLTARGVPGTRGHTSEQKSAGATYYVGNTWGFRAWCREERI